MARSNPLLTGVKRSHLEISRVTGVSTGCLGCVMVGIVMEKEVSPYFVVVGCQCFP